MNKINSSALYELAGSLLGTGIFSGATVLDVGSLKFEQSIELKNLGAKVTALDRHQPKVIPDGIKFVYSDFLDFHTDQKFDIVYLSNSAMFMPTENVMAKIEELKPKYIMVKSMFNYPEPNWDKDQLQTLYFTLPEDWTDYFEPLGYKTVYQDSYKHEAKDFHGVSRKFSITNYIGVRDE